MHYSYVAIFNCFKLTTFFLSFYCDPQILSQIRIFIYLVYYILLPYHYIYNPSKKKNLARVSGILQEYPCKTCTFLQEMDHLSCTLHYLARILQETSMNVRFLQDSCKILQNVRQMVLFLQECTSLASILLSDCFTGSKWKVVCCEVQQFYKSR